MKIGIVDTIWLNTPPKGYGGTEEMIYSLVNGLSSRGHDVTVFGPKTDKVKAQLYPTIRVPLRENNISWTNFPYTLYHITEAFDFASKFDILHVHLNKNQDFVALPLALYSKTPVIFTVHFPAPSQSLQKDQYHVLHKYGKLPFTSISNSQRNGLPLNFIKTVYNGLNITKFPFKNEAEDYFAWIGKISSVKGTKEAIEAAKKANVRLYLMGAVDRGVPKMFSYYRDEIKPLFDGKNIIWLGEADLKLKSRILGGAKAFINPINWEEPFGMVMAEAQAVGTPVIAFNRGSAPELIKDGKTGFVVDTMEEMVQKIKEIDKIKREDCRHNAEKNFSVESMVSGYEKAYTIAIENWGKYLENQKEFIKKRYHYVI